MNGILEVIGTWYLICLIIRSAHIRILFRQRYFGRIVYLPMWVQMARASSVLHLRIFWVLSRRATTKKAAIINIPFAFETDNNTCGIRNILLQHKCSIYTSSKLLKHDALKSDDTVEEEKSRWTFPLTQRQYYSRSTWRINIVSYYLVMQRAQKANEKLDDASLFYSGSKYYI